MSQSIRRGDPEDDRLVDAPVERGGVQPVGIAIRFIRNSPWLAIAAMIHVIVIVVMSVVYMQSHRPAPEDNLVTSIGITGASLELPEPIEIPPEPIDRNSVPVLPDQQEGPVNPDPQYIPDAAPGRKGEITDEVDPTKEAGIFNPDPEALSNLPSGATGGTAIGVGAIGHHGTGTPSAFVSRRAGAGGRGGGGLGQGGGGGRGGKNAEYAVMSALQWLAKHQSPDGRWSCAGFDAQCKLNKCGGPGQPVYDVGVTGLALLCFLGAGETPQSPAYGKVVRNGLKYLISVQTPDGCIGSQTAQRYQYNHMCAALAMTEAYGMTGLKAFQEPAQKAVGFIQKSQNPYLAWRYGIADGSNDTSVTGWAVMVLKSAILSGLEVDGNAIKSAMVWIEMMTDPTYGRVGYIQKGSGPARTTELMEAFPSEQSEALTAVGVLVRIFAGHTAKEDPLIEKGGDLMLAKLPRWDTKSGTIDMYYWYYGTLAMFQLGGDYFNKWNEAMKTAIIDHQRLEKNQDEYGSWDPLDPWCEDGGRVYSTALNCLCMEVYYRYPRVFGAPGHDKVDKGSARSEKAATDTADADKKK